MESKLKGEIVEQKWKIGTSLRERPFNLKGGGGGLWFFSKKIF